MSQIYSIIENRKGKYLSGAERYKIEVLIQEKLSPKEIAKILNRDKRTIERELDRGKVKLLNSDLTYRIVYCADIAQRKYEANSKNKGPNLKIGKDHKLAQYIEQKIKEEKYSPDAVIGQIKGEGLIFESSICTKTLYNYIDKEVFANLSNKDLLVKKNKKKRKYKKVKTTIRNKKGTSIEERSEYIDKREEYGHWEMDCVVGKREGKGAVLLVLSERKTRQEIIRKIPNKTQDSVIKEIDKLERKYGKKFNNTFKTITVDNGSEFLDFESLETSIKDKSLKRTKIYYAHPYSSWERGTNENTNKMIRRFIPKGTDIDKITHTQIKKIEQWINDYPRRILGYKSANKIAS